MSAPGNTSHHGVMVQKKGLGVLPSPRDWWSWGDLNPRPQAFFGQFYMCSRLFCFLIQGAAQRHAAPQTSTLFSRSPPRYPVRNQPI